MSNIPNFTNTPAVDIKTGNWTPEWANLLQQLFSELQTNIGTEGVKLPQLTANQITQLKEIALLEPENAAASNSNMFYNITLNDSDSANIFINGVLYKFTLTPV